MLETCVGFVDVGYLQRTGSAKLNLPPRVNLQADAVVEWLRSVVEKNLNDHTFLRAYWYDGEYDPSHQNYGDQRRLFSAIARTPGVQLRLGHISERPNRFEARILEALRRTADDLNQDPEQLLEAFSRQWTFRPERQQKGVDTLIALDMVRLASRSVYTTAVLIAGDRDLAEAVRTAQDYGARVVIATPNQQSVAQEVVQLADGLIEITSPDLEPILPHNSRPGNRL